jgi:hypothetical protein
MTKKVALYDFDPSNGGQVTYYGAGCHMTKAKGVLSSAVKKFFLDTIHDGDPDAVVIDMPGNPTALLTATYGNPAMALASIRSVGYEPVLLHPVCPEDDTSKSLAGALMTYGSEFIHVAFLNHGKEDLDKLAARRGFDVYNGRGVDGKKHAVDENGDFHGSLRARLFKNGGMEVILPALDDDAAELINTIRSPFHVARNYKSLRDLAVKKGMDSDDLRTISNLTHIMVSQAERHIEAMVKLVEERVAEKSEALRKEYEATGEDAEELRLPLKPAFFLYSIKGGEGKSLFGRLLAEYLRHTWAHGKAVAVTKLVNGDAVPFAIPVSKRPEDALAEMTKGA